jgi:cyanobactin maturation PatA/PatG family protease
LIGRTLVLGARLTPLAGLVAEAAADGRMSAHGTRIASMIFGRHGCGMRGLAPGCSGFLGQIFSDQRWGPASQRDLARMIEQAVEAGAHIINISGAELSPSGVADPILADAVRLCRDRRVLIVAAAGNDACHCLHVPAALPSVLAVGAMNGEGLPLDASNWGEAYQSQGILAPGVNMLGAVPGGGFGLKSGTSFATPTGVAALLLSMQIMRGGKLDTYSVREALLKSAERCEPEKFSGCQRFLVGKLNVPGAHALISKGETIPMSELHTHGEMPQTTEPNSGSAQPAVAASGQETAASPVSFQPNGVGVATPVPVSSPSVQALGIARSPQDGSGTRRLSRVVAPQGVSPQGCACQGNGSKQLVVAIGVLNYDFGTEARRDGFKQLMPSVLKREK